MRTLFPFLIGFALLISCTNEVKLKEKALKKKKEFDKTKITENLSSRFTGFEVVEIRPDSSYLLGALDDLRVIRINIAMSNTKIIKTLADFEDGTLKWSGKRVYQHIDSVYNNISKRMQRFEDKRFSQEEPCYYVKYRIFDGADKIEREEYFVVNDVGNTEQKEYEVLSRPVGWDEFMSQKEYGTIIDDALTYYKDILHYKYKYGGQ